MAYTSEALAKARIYNKRYRMAHPERAQARQVRYREANREKVNENRRKWYIQHKEAEQIRKRAIRADNLEKFLDQERKWRASNLEAHRAAVNNWYARNKAARRAYMEAYNKTHPESAVRNSALRRARSAGLPATLSKDQWKAIKGAYKNRCAYCGQKAKRLTQDHVIPVSKGGGYTPDNIVPSCLSCNSSKGAREGLTIPPLRLLL